MKRLIFLTLFVADIAIARPPKRSCQHSENTFCKVELVRVIDGDTIVVNIPKVHPLLGREIRIRLAGIDTPEIFTKDPIEKARGLVAKKKLEEMFEHPGKIRLRNVERGKYFRIVADVTIGKKWLNFDMRNYEK